MHDYALMNTINDAIRQDQWRRMIAAELMPVTDRAHEVRTALLMASNREPELALIVPPHIGVGLDQVHGMKVVRAQVPYSFVGVPA